MTTDFNKLAKEIYEDSRDGLTNDYSSSNASSTILHNNSIVPRTHTGDKMWQKWNINWLKKRNTYLERFGKSPPLKMEILIIEKTLREHFEK